MQCISMNVEKEMVIFSLPAHFFSISTEDREDAGDIGLQSLSGHFIVESAYH